MGASYPDLNRCNYMFADDRRCRNPIETPGAAFCVYHRHKSEKDARPKGPRAVTRPRTAAAEALFQWLCYHPLDTATSIHQTLNQIVILLATGSLSPREADTYLRLCRQMFRSAPEVRNEFRIRSLSDHKPAGEKFLAEVRESLVPAIVADDCVAAATPAAATPAPHELSLEEAVAAALAADPDRRLAVEAYMATSMPDGLDSQHTPPSQNASIEPPVPACGEPVESTAPGAATVAERPVTVDARIAKYLTAPLSRAVSLPNPPAKSSQRASP